MSDKAYDEKTTVILNIEELKREKKQSEEVLAKTVDSLEFSLPQVSTSVSMYIRIILFDFESDFFHLLFEEFPAGYDYYLTRELSELNEHLISKTPLILVLNYDSNPKVINNLSSQVKKKFSHVKTLLMAEKISPEKARLHAQSPAGAHGYFELPLGQERFIDEVERIIKLFDNTDLTRNT
jgi:hypothetical protein